MAEVIGIFGDSGSGKSSSIMNLDPKSIFIINCLGKRLPFKGSGSLYNKENMNYFESDNYEQICSVLLQVGKQEHIKNIILDDATYIMTNEFMNRAKEKGFDKFTELAIHFKKILDVAKSLPQDKKVFILGHLDLDENGNYKVKTVGKLLDSQWNVQGLFTTLLMTYVESEGNTNAYKFVTNKYGSYTAKSPLGMFEDILIPNDLNYVSQKIDEYYK
jgi:hypothetical protein